MAQFFIKHPIFAMVIAIVTVMAGLLALQHLPLQQYPDIAPPTISVQASYPGASAQTVEETVTQVIEQGILGIDHLLYMSSTSDSLGSASVNLTFKAGTDPDMAQIQVQNKVAQIESLLPTAVLQSGVRFSKANAGFLMGVALFSEDGSLSREDLGDFAHSVLRGPLSRVEGVGNVVAFGAPYAMRVWLDAEQLQRYDLTSSEVADAIAAQNRHLALGELGAIPAVEGQQLNANLIYRNVFDTPQHFENILLKVDETGGKVTLGDVARVELGAQDYAALGRYKGMRSTVLAFQLANGANALETSARLKQALDDLREHFPPGMNLEIAFDTTPFIEASLNEVLKTLVEAIVLVVLVMYLFLGSVRATLIPALAVPVVLAGTLGVLAVADFSINTLTMFAMVLAIGLLVDDAIVVVENVERLMHEESLTAREATQQAMSQITGALVGIAMVLSAVFIPMAFVGGSSGIIYRQFSLTIATAMGLSVLVALTLTPALCAMLLKPPSDSGPLRPFHRWFDRQRDAYPSGLQRILKRPLRMGLLYLALCSSAVWVYKSIPSSLLPNEDQGIFFTLVQLPAGATRDQTLAVLHQIEDYLETEESVASVFSVAGFSFVGRGQNMGIAFVRLKHWDERTSAEQSGQAIVARAAQALAKIDEAQIFPIMLPPIPALGTSSGFDGMLVDRNGLGHDALLAARNEVISAARADARLTGVRPNGMEDVPSMDIQIDHQKLLALGLSIDDVTRNLGIAWASSYVNDFILAGRSKRVYLQAEAEDRMLPADLSKWYVRNSAGDMVSMGNIVDGQWRHASPQLTRFNGMPAMNIRGQAAEGHSSLDAINILQQLVQQLPQGFTIEWAGTSFEEVELDSTTLWVYLVSILFVFLCLAALYESWTLPISVIIVIPLGILGALLAIKLLSLGNDIYLHVGLLTTIGLTARNAILIVEFAEQLRARGLDLTRACIEASRLRLRPILMTSLSFGFGVLPLAISSGAGELSRNTIGSAVFGGVLSATLLPLIFVPLFYLYIARFVEAIPGLFQRQPAAGEAL